MVGSLVGSVVGSVVGSLWGRASRGWLARLARRLIGSGDGLGGWLVCRRGVFLKILSLLSKSVFMAEQEVIKHVKHAVDVARSHRPWTHKLQENAAGTGSTNMQDVLRLSEARGVDLCFGECGG